ALWGLENHHFSPLTTIISHITYHFNHCYPQNRSLFTDKWTKNVVCAMVATVLSTPEKDDSMRYFILVLCAACTQPGEEFRETEVYDGPFLYRDVTDDIGLTPDPSCDQHGDGSKASNSGSGIDLDNDGDVDLIEARQACTTRVFLNTNGILSEAPDHPLTNVERVSMFAGGDLDQDGDTDIVAAMFHFEKPTSTTFSFPSPAIRIFFNEGDGWDYEEVDVDLPFGIANAVTLVDLDGDGTLEILLARAQWINVRGSPDSTALMPPNNVLFYTNGRYEDRARELGLDDSGHTWVIVPIDMDGDSVPEALGMWNDLPISEGSEGNVKISNERATAIYYPIGDGTFGRHTLGEGHSPTPMGGAVCDPNRDGVRDIVYTEDPERVLSTLEGTDPKQWTNWATPAGIRGVRGEGIQLVGWAVLCFDYDLDGDMDLLITNGTVGGEPGLTIQPEWLYEEAPTQPISLYRNNGDSTFTEVAKETGLIADGHGRGGIILDWDDDGIMEYCRGGWGEGMRCYKTQRTKNQCSLTVHLLTEEEVAVSNAEITVTINGRSQIVQMPGTNPYGYSQQGLLRIGVPCPDQQPSVTVVATSGTQEPLPVTIRTPVEEVVLTK
ncbi:MAG TPA: VCBS repeat-containing protein, partial [Candidatus Kapabacteria bacterium]|nr:VCBS repeat-containing protein [Candidatus Kapabacteria bacterium]